MSNVKTFELTTRRGWWIVFVLAIGTVVNGTIALWILFTGGIFTSNIVNVCALNLALISNLSWLTFLPPTKSRKGLSSREVQK